MKKLKHKTLDLKVTKINNLAIRLFGGVLVDPNSNKGIEFVNGVSYPKGTLYAQSTIENYLSEGIDSFKANLTFYKDWNTVQNKRHTQWRTDQIRHYMSTYGTNFTGEAVFPETRELDSTLAKRKFFAVNAYDVEGLKTKCLMMLSGVALKQETMEKVVELLYTQLGHNTLQGVNNKEAVIYIADQYGIVPTDPVEALRYMVYKITESTLLIKNESVITAIEESDFNFGQLYRSVGADNFAPIFNRFKKLFVALKKANKVNKPYVNRISKRSKVLHKGMVLHPLDRVTQKRLYKNDFEKVSYTNYHILRALFAINDRLNRLALDVTDCRMYKVRNGKSWFAKGKSILSKDQLLANYNLCIGLLRDKVDLRGKTYFIPKFVEYALPTSEKSFIGKIPTGTQLTFKRLSVGVYWENEGGANDIDLSASSVSEKIGWNTHHRSFDKGNSVQWSGDVTDAPRGAAEYMYTDGILEPFTIISNVYSGSDKASARLIISKEKKKSKIGRVHDIDGLLFDEPFDHISKETNLGFLMPSKDGKKVTYVFNIFGSGYNNVSGNSQMSQVNALFQKWSNPLTLNKVLVDLGASVISKTPKEESKVINLDFDNIKGFELLEIFAD